MIFKSAQGQVQPRLVEGSAARRGQIAAAHYRRSSKRSGGAGRCGAGREDVHCARRTLRGFPELLFLHVF